jgi:hypothetical protein
MKMNKILLILIIGLVVFTALPVLAADKSPASKTVYLYQGNQSDETAWGKLTYNVSGSTFDFSFTGIAPIANDWYALVVGDDPLNHPETAVILDYPRSGGDTGEINITKSIELNRDFKKIQVWLVLGSDIITDGRYTTITEWIGWHTQYYLFGTKLVNYNDIYVH